jgi:hypothetical protein
MSKPLETIMTNLLETSITKPLETIMTKSLKTIMTKPMCIPFSMIIYYRYHAILMEFMRKIWI